MSVGKFVGACDRREGGSPRHVDVLQVLVDAREEFRLPGDFQVGISPCGAAAGSRQKEKRETAKTFIAVPPAATAVTHLLLR